MFHQNIVPHYYKLLLTLSIYKYYWLNRNKEPLWIQRKLMPFRIYKYQIGKFLLNYYKQLLSRICKYHYHRCP